MRTRSSRGPSGRVGYWAADGRVACMLRRTQSNQVTQVLYNLSERADKVGKTGVLRTHETPDQPEYNQSKHNAADQHMQIEPVIFQHIGDQKTDRQQPVEKTHQRIPDPDSMLFCFIHGANSRG